MSWENLCPKLTFTAENKMGNPDKAGHISTLLWWKRYSISSILNNLSVNSVKYVFHLEKWNFEPTGNLTHKTGFTKGPAKTLTPLSPNVNKANINSNR